MKNTHAHVYGQTTAQIMDTTECHYWAGYHACSIEDCPHAKSTSGPYVLWMQGWHQHQRDRERVAELAARRGCLSPSRINVQLQEKH